MSTTTTKKPLRAASDVLALMSVAVLTVGALLLAIGATVGLSAVALASSWLRRRLD